MAWDSSRPVNWKRVFRDWAIYMAILSVVFLAFNREQGLAGLIGMVIFSLPLFFGFAYVLAKLGFDQRRNVRSRTSNDSASTSTPRQSGSSSGPRPKPAPTKRTGGGRPTSSHKSRR